MLCDVTSESGPPWGGPGPRYIRSRPPRLVWDLHVCEQDPSNGIRTPLYKVRVDYSGVLEFQGRIYSSPSQGPDRGPEPTRVQTQSGRIQTLSLLFPTHVGIRCCHVAYCAWRKPTDKTGHKARRLRASWHSLQIRRASARYRDRLRAQYTLPGLRSYSYVTVARTMTHHYSRVSRIGLLPINAVWTTAIITSADYSCITKAEETEQLHLYAPTYIRHTGLLHTQLQRTILRSALIIRIIYSFHYAHGPTCRSSASLYVPPLDYKRDSTQRYKGTQHTDTIQLTDSGCKVLRSCGLNHYKPSRTFVFIG
jgi:hypothetical protein